MREGRRRLIIVLHASRMTRFPTLSSSNQLQPLHGANRVSERAIITYLLKTDELIDELGRTRVGVLEKNKEGKVKRRHEEKVGFHASLLALF